MGSSVRNTVGSGDAHFITAMYIAGDTLTSVGTSDYVPSTPLFRILYTINSFIGMSVITLTVTYFLEIYSALQKRNVLAFNLHLASSETGDAC